MITQTGIFMAARIYNRVDGKTYDLWTANTAMVLTSLEVEMVQGGNNTIRATFLMPYDIGVQYLESTLFAMNNVLMVQFGYASEGYTTPWMVGLIKIPGVQMDESVTISLEAPGAGALAMGCSSDKTHTGTLQQIVQGLCDRMGWELEWEPDIWTAEPVEISQNGESYWTFLSNILHKYGRTFRFGVADAKPSLYCYEISSLAALPPVRTFIKWGIPNIEKNEYPLLSFSTQQQLFTLPGSASIKSSWLDLEGNVISYEAHAGETLATKSTGAGAVSTNTPTDESHPETGTTISLSMDKDESGKRRNISPLGTSYGDPAATMRTLHQADHDSKVVAWDATGQCVGMPDMLPGECIKIVGCSSYYDGNYTVSKVNHSISDGGFTTSFEMRKTAPPSQASTEPASRPPAPPAT